MESEPFEQSYQRALQHDLRMYLGCFWCTVLCSSFSLHSEMLVGFHVSFIYITRELSRGGLVGRWCCVAFSRGVI